MVHRLSHHIDEVPPKFDTIEAGPVKEVEVTESESPEETLPVKSPAPGPVSEPSSKVKEVVIDAEPVVAEEQPTVDELEVPIPGPQEKVEEPAPVVAVPVEEPRPLTDATEREVSPVPEPTPEPTLELASEDPTLGVLKSEIPEPEPALGGISLVESESVTKLREHDVAHPATSPEENPSTDEAGQEEATPTILEPIEAAQDVPTSDVPQEESEIGHSQSSWTPSYSVSSQGGGLDDAAPVDEEVVEPTTAPEPPVEETVAGSAPVPEIVTSAEVCAFRGSFPSSTTDPCSLRSLLLPS